MTQMLYRAGDSLHWEGGQYDTKIVQEGDIDAHIAEGWFLNPLDVWKVSDAPPTREELEAKATELGLKFDGRTTDAKLAKLIEEAIK